MNMDKYKDLLSKVEADCFLVSHQVNVRYLTGFKGTLGYLLVSKKGNYFLTDSRYFEYATSLIKDAKICLLKDGLVSELKSIFRKIKPKSLAYEYGNVSYIFYSRIIRNITPGKIIAAKDVIENMRMVKTQSEIRKIKKACSIILKSVNEIGENYKKFKGWSEKKIGDKLEEMIREKGALSSAFPTIVAEGKHSSQPHHHPTNKRASFSPLLIDAGAVFEDYNSDLTRTFSNHTISGKFNEIFQIVKEAQARAFQAIKPGVFAKEVDRAARVFISRSGYGEYFGHGLGHGIGLDVHEKPILSRKGKVILKPGMVFTVEPGIYIPGLFGCRIEDVIVVTEKGYRLLTK